MLTAHCDEIGFLVRYIDDNGFIYFATIGGFDPSTFPANESTFIPPRSHSGCHWSPARPSPLR